MLPTHFAPAERLIDQELQQSIASIVHHPILNVIMTTNRGLIAILNQWRQIVAMNRGLMDSLGIDEPEQYFGQRPGEVLNCVHAKEMEGGCGTTMACPSCGAVLAVIATMASRRPVEKDCILTVFRQKKQQELVFRINACPLELGADRFTMVTLRDVTSEYRRNMLERSFLHDLGNILSAGRMLLDETMDDGLEDQTRILETRLLFERLVRELEIQRSMINDIEFTPRIEPLDLGMFLHDLAMRCSFHPSAGERRIRVVRVEDGLVIQTDPVLLGRVLENLLINACEASEPGDVIRLSAHRDAKLVSLSVWNPGVIPGTIQKRIFQRYFSTKTGDGRGMGTFSARMFVESMLKGSIDFVSEPDPGTVFTVRLPV